MKVFRTTFFAAVLWGVCAVGAQGAEDCLECHGLRGLAVQGRALWLTEADHAASVHGRLTCSDCHKGVEAYPHPAPQVRCDLPCHVAGVNHEAVVRAEAGSVHAAALGGGCGGCHTAGRAPRGKDVERLCRSCHADLDEEDRLLADGPGAFGFWGHRAASTRSRTPACPDCHGVHGIRRAAGARAACRNAGCHPAASEAFSLLFDHRAAAPRPPWGGAGPAALALSGLIAAVLALHAVRRP